MSSIWLPGLVILVVGLAVGILAAVRLGRRVRATPAEEDQRLRIADLEARRDELYRRLRELPPDARESGEQAALELAAARVLRDLDELKASAVPPDREKQPEAEPTPAAESAGPQPRRYPALVGFLAGAAAVGLIALLVYWAGRDATPGPPPPPQPRGVAQLPPDHPEIPSELPAEAQQRMAALAARLDSEPEDLMARKELALLHLSGGQYMEAYREAQELLERQADDPDALYVQGVVRVLMGNNEEALSLLDRVLARFPNHLQALVYRGVALYQSGQPERAVDSWQVGLEMAGGRHPEIERLLEMASQEMAAVPFTAAPPPDAAAPPPLPATPPAAVQPPPAGAVSMAGSGFPIRIELAEGVRADPAAVLFVILRPAETGPPTAVRRIAAPRFPIEVVLGDEDSMMGAELPESGFLSVRLDGDGDASSRGPDDLAAEAQVRQSTATTLVLGG